MSAPFPQPRKRRGPVRTGLGCLAVVGGLAVLSFGLDRLADRIDELFHPWAYARGDRPTLTGVWVGPLTTGSGQRRALLVELQIRDPSPSGSGTRSRAYSSVSLRGRATMCAPREPLRRFTVYGHPRAKGSGFDVGLSPVDSVPPDGLTPSHVHAAWDGRERLDAEVSLHVRKRQSAISSSDDPDTGRKQPLAMRRGTEADFEGMCRGLAGAAGQRGATAPSLAAPGRPR